MPKRIEDLLKMYRNELEAIAGHQIMKVILYGSYARGDFTKDSDIDILILVDLKDFKVCEDRMLA